MIGALALLGLLFEAFVFGTRERDERPSHAIHLYPIPIKIYKLTSSLYLIKFIFDVFIK
jgi:hypothetical protein